MRLPRRVPWASLAELEEICAAIYADENDLDAKVFAINRISAWRTVTSLPHALESALALLVVLVHDKKQIYLTALQLRQSYATAILRLVNGLVDPLQVGTYARPITSIAQQLGLPGWLVELRHASTHEDLPSLDLLREATRQSLSWLLQNYFLPILNPVSNSLQSLPALRPLMPLLKLYKSTMKTVTKDLSLHSRYRPKIVAILRDIERWISEAKVSANIVAGDPDGSDVDFKEIWALERFCEGLIEKGMLVPLSKKKRQYSESELLPSRSSVASWSHLLDHLHGIHPDFFSVLSRQLTSTLMQADPDTEEAKLDPTYRAYITCWILWIVEASRNSPPASLEIKKQVLSSLVKGFNHGTMPQLSQSIVPVLLRKVCSSRTEFETVSLLLSSANAKTTDSSWDPHFLDVMSERNDILRLQNSTVNGTPVSTRRLSKAAAIPGWTLLESKPDWECCPIGVYTRPADELGRELT